MRRQSAELLYRDSFAGTQGSHYHLIVARVSIKLFLLIVALPLLYASDVSVDRGHVPFAAHPVV